MEPHTNVYDIYRLTLYIGFKAYNHLTIDHRGTIALNQVENIKHIGTTL